MKIINSPTQIKKQLSEYRQKSIGFVPSLGGLHSGHLSLIKRCIKENDFTVVSLFLNPTQFNDARDLKTYPSSMEEDLKILSELNVDMVFTPSFTDLYPDDYHYSVDESLISQNLCGRTRPGHFKGVLTVVMKLFNIVQPQRAYFGEKDFQQLQLIRGMTAAFFLDTQIVACPIVRDSSGLALSSRNNKLSPQGLSKAQSFAQLLQSTDSKNRLIEKLKEQQITVDYIEDIDNRRFAAVEIENVRLIDNVAL